MRSGEDVDVTTEAAVTFGDRLKEYRLAAGLTQEALAERAGVSARNIQNLERGENKPLKDTARRLAEALGLDERDRTLLLTTVLPTPRHRSDHAAFPPPAAPSPADPPAPVAPARHNLPSMLSSFIGREHEQTRVIGLLANHRLVTLTGSGGVGKTRLALAVATDRLDAYPAGVWLVELASLADSSLVPGAVAAALAVREDPGRPILATLTNFLKGKRLLLVLDNCEHLLTACAELAIAVRRACPEVCILATSREGLGVTGERRYRVPSLSVPNPTHLPPPELAGSYEAVRLFVTRAQERRDDFVLSERNAQAIAEICARLDGVPLAIELAAARVASVSVETIAARLDDRFRLLTSGSRDLPSRQRTLRAALDWSWDLLDQAERVLLGRLAVFAGGWTLEASEAICAGDGLESWTVLDALDSLVNRSLVQVDEAEEGAGRYRLLETVRQYGWERLRAGGEDAKLRDRHLNWCLELARAAALEYRGPAQGTWFGRLETEQDNLRAALDWSLRQDGDTLAGLRLAAEVWWFWYIRGNGEGRQWLEAALVRSAMIDVPADLRATLLQGAGIMAGRHGDYERARILHEERLVVRRALEDKLGIASALVDLGGIAWFQGRYDRAREYFEESLDLHRALENTWGICGALTNLGVLVRNQGDPERARTLQEESLTLARELGDKSHIACVLGNLGVVVQELGNYTAAQDYFAESLL
ncbi:MAG TPA: tetratricopeptide repeat protein, partial [Chloroflexota bacterium]|nr:tetratricopeptide repeat protein [Chloroflexota bacterium]